MSYLQEYTLPFCIAKPLPTAEGVSGVLSMCQM